MTTERNLLSRIAFEESVSNRDSGSDVFKHWLAWSSADIDDILSCDENLLPTIKHFLPSAFFPLTQRAADAAIGKAVRRAIERQVLRDVQKVQRDVRKEEEEGNAYLWSEMCADWGGL